MAAQYRYARREKRLALGVYPEVSLKEAWLRSAEARRLLSNDIDPAELRRMQRKAREPRAADSFEGVAREWFLKFSKTWAESHSTRIMRRFERDVFPWIGKRLIDELNAQDVLRVLRRIEGRGAIETAHRALENCNRVFRYAVATGRAVRDPCTDLRGALAPARTTHLAAATEPEQAAQILRMTDSYQSTYVVACALRLAPLVFVRPGELRKARWADVNLDAAEWPFRISKTETDHIVSLARRAVTILRDLHRLTGHSTFVFPSARSDDRPMSDKAVLGALRHLGIAKNEMTGHSVRAMARTILDEVLKFRPDLIEHQLARAVRDPLRGAYTAPPTCPNAVR